MEEQRKERLRGGGRRRSQAPVKLVLNCLRKPSTPSKVLTESRRNRRSASRACCFVKEGCININALVPKGDQGIKINPGAIRDGRREAKGGRMDVNFKNIISATYTVHEATILWLGPLREITSTEDESARKRALPEVVCGVDNGKRLAIKGGGEISGRVVGKHEFYRVDRFLGIEHDCKAKSCEECSRFHG